MDAAEFFRLVVAPLVGLTFVEMVVAMFAAIFECNKVSDICTKLSMVTGSLMLSGLGYILYVAMSHAN